jgi:methionyl-tRNA formyltransferase
LRIALVAEESAGVQVLRELAARGAAVELAAVLGSSAPRGYGRPVVREAAASLGVDVWDAELVRTPGLARRLVEGGIDVLLNVHSLFVLHPAVVTAPSIGSFNLHPGPLPQYAGLNVPSWAVYNGEVSHAVTLHWMDDGIDTGDVVATASFDLTPSDTGLSVTAKCVRHGLPLIRALVDCALDRTGITRQQQDLSRRRYYKAGPPHGGRLEWTRPAVEITRFVRASDYRPFPSPWPHPEGTICGLNVGISAAKMTGVSSRETPGTVRALTDEGAEIATADEAVRVEQVWVDGRYRKPIDIFRG